MAEGTALLVNEHLKQDNERLMGMLATTPEYSNFGAYAEGSTFMKDLEK